MRVDRAGARSGPVLARVFASVVARVVAGVVVGVVGLAIAAVALDGDRGEGDGVPTTARASKLSTTVPPEEHGIPPVPAPARIPDGAPAVPLPGLQGMSAIAVYGDSLVLQAWGYLEELTHRNGVALHGGAYGGLALCDWVARIESDLRSTHVDRVVLAFAGNNITPCTGAEGRRHPPVDQLVATYTRDLMTVLDIARAEGVAQVVAVGPPFMEDPDWDDRARRLREAYRTVAGEAREMTYVDASRRLGPTGYSAQMPCLAFETPALGCRGGSVRVRSTDGVHLAEPGSGGYSAGAWRFAIALLDRGEG
jgi:hypothetical protein